MKQQENADVGALLKEVAYLQSLIPRQWGKPRQSMRNLLHMRFGPIYGEEIWRAMYCEEED